MTETVSMGWGEECSGCRGEEVCVCACVPVYSCVCVPMCSCACACACVVCMCVYKLKDRLLEMVLSFYF